MLNGCLFEIKTMNAPQPPSADSSSGLGQQVCVAEDSCHSHLVDVNTFDNCETGSNIIVAPLTLAGLPCREVAL